MAIIEIVQLINPSLDVIHVLDIGHARFTLNASFKCHGLAHVVWFPDLLKVFNYHRNLIYLEVIDSDRCWPLLIIPNFQKINSQYEW